MGTGRPEAAKISRPMAEAAPKKDEMKKARSALSRRKKWLLGLGLGLPASVLVLWILVHRVEWLGPLIANSLRAVIGPDRVAKLEDFAYGVEDKFNRWWKKDEKPKAYWEVPPDESAEPVAAVDAGPDAPPPPPPFRPKDVPPVHESWSAPGDGKWVRIVDKRRPKEPAYMFKTLLHPDKNRSWAELFVVAVDLRRVQVQAVAGYREPKSSEAEAQKYERKATIPKEHHEELLAAFNGGFMTEHGWYGMKVDGVTLVKPRKKACTFVHYEDGSYEIATWSNIETKEPKMKWARQAPGCMYERGEMHIGLKDPNNRSWGATLDGETVIRRSAVGLSEDRKVLYVGMGNSTTAAAIARGMFHAGAVDVAQLDVNWSYPKFVLFEPAEAGPDRMAVALAEGFEFSENEYIRKRSYRDFFYMVRSDTGATPRN